MAETISPHPLSVFLREDVELGFKRGITPDLLGMEIYFACDRKTMAHTNGRVSLITAELPTGLDGEQRCLILFPNKEKALAFAENTGHGFRATTFAMILGGFRDDDHGCALKNSDDDTSGFVLSSQDITAYADFSLTHNETVAVNKLLCGLKTIRNHEWVPCPGSINNGPQLFITYAPELGEDTRKYHGHLTSAIERISPRISVDMSPVLDLGIR